MQHRRLWTSTLVAVVLVATAGLVALTRDTGDPEPAAAPAASTAPVRVVLPGRPGESAAVTGSDQVQAPDGSAYNGIDVAYAQMMIVHHRQAIVMADLAPGRAVNTGVTGIAARIKAGQGPEIVTLQAWLSDRGQPESDPAHDHATMPGMQADTAMTALAAATGADFDRLFVTMMTAHHRGAQQMAGDLVRGGTDQRLGEMANETAVEQVVEIRRMAELGIA
ncbi:DUF305 domain-containing protein [Actinoplanes sp. NBRC 101535]|uniref:DUF305 domain-containing protein n=1 Tax=Actinoplanes sp. NBRC 101535 TaxID=3032196 RepID=UPI0024A2EBE6|nr:DUF305 domain-containing protein [Actinoplanes sp. NBRC 101535]GLY01297.1 lipoprotein [Actinoplanes sp. NBRC 101535]